MFSIQKKEEAGFEKVFLRNDATGNFAAIIPSSSAMLHEFSVRQNNESINVIDSYQSFDEFKNHVEEKGFLGCKLSPFLCRLNNAEYNFAEKKYHIKKSLPAKHALHGLLYDKKFIIISEASNELNAFVTMKYEYRAEDSGYPFNYDCIVTWQLQPENKLTVITECVNKDQGLIPMQDGWHPYFTLGDSIDDLHLEFQAKKMVEFNSDLIPTKKLIDYTKFSSIEKIGNIKLDNCFILDTQECQPLCVLRDVEKKIEVQFFPGESYPYLQIYTPGHRRSIAIENISGAPDAFNNGMGFITLEQGQSALFKTSYKIMLLNKT
ncbi:MAG: aldose 1-epimerase [Bacteroidota bacterium]|nr:aldose 1-epimerase [Bacteroidota bacterium]